MSDERGPDALRSRLARVAAQARGRLAGRAEELTRAASDLAAGDERARDEIRRLAHRIRGIGGSIGREDLSAPAARAEEAAGRIGADDPDVHRALVIERARQLADAIRRPPTPGETRSDSSREATEPISRGEPGEDADRSPDRARRERVLVVDDDDATRRLLELSLARLGYVATSFADAERGLRAALDAAPAVIVVDAMMPGLSGLDLYDALRASGPPALPVIILSAASADELGWTIPADPHLMWVRKPYSHETLGRILRELTGTGAPRG